MDKKTSLQEDACKCPDCERRAAEHKESEEFGLAILIAFMPIMTLTIFGHIGLL